MKKAALAFVPFMSMAVLAVLPACGNNDDPYKPIPAFSGRKASLPTVPSLPTDKIKDGDAFTIYGAYHHLNSSIHNPDVTAKDITLIGWIVDSNMATVDKCAIHKTGKKDPDGCVTAIPYFTLSDKKDGKSDTKAPKIRVLGWASNFANIFDALEKYKNLKEPPKELYKDELWAMDIPVPLPAVGARVKVTGKYGVNFGKSSAGIEADPVYGIMTYDKIEYLEQAPEPASFPQLKP